MLGERFAITYPARILTLMLMPIKKEKRRKIKREPNPFKKLPKLQKWQVVPGKMSKKKTKETREMLQLKNKVRRNKMMKSMKTTRKKLNKKTKIKMEVFKRKRKH